MLTYEDGKGALQNLLERCIVGALYSQWVVTVPRTPNR